MVQPLLWRSLCYGAASGMVQPLLWNSLCHGAATMVQASMAEQGHAVHGTLSHRPAWLPGPIGYATGTAGTSSRSTTIQG